MKKKTFLESFTLRNNIWINPRMDKKWNYFMTKIILPISLKMQLPLT